MTPETAGALHLALDYVRTRQRAVSAVVVYTLPPVPWIKRHRSDRDSNAIPSAPTKQSLVKKSFGQIPLKNSVVFRRIRPVIDGCEALSVASSAGLRLIALMMGF